VTFIPTFVLYITVLRQCIWSFRDRDGYNNRFLDSVRNMSTDATSNPNMSNPKIELSKSISEVEATGI